MEKRKILDDLIAAGVPSDTILEVAKLLAEAEHAQKVREQTRLRVEKHRQAKRTKNDIGLHVALRNDTETLRNVTPPQHIYPPQSRDHKNDLYMPALQESGLPGRRKPARKKEPLPDGFSLGEPLSSFASRIGWGSAKIQSEFERFCDHARANNRKQADWNAAWRNWVTSPYQKPEKINGNHVRTASDVLREMCERTGSRTSEDTGWLLPEN